MDKLEAVARALAKRNYPSFTDADIDEMWEGYTGDAQAAIRALADHETQSTIIKQPCVEQVSDKVAALPLRPFQAINYIKDEADLEAYGGERIIAWADSSHAPDRGDLINIRKTTYKVIGRTYTLDHADEPCERGMVCVINLSDSQAPGDAV